LWEVERAALRCSWVSRLTLLVCLALGACQPESDRSSPGELVHGTPPRDRDPPDGSVDIPGDDCGTPPAADYCGQTFLREVTDPPNLYFVLDRSGSMAAPFEGSALDKYQTARSAIVRLLKDIGHRVRYGAAIFPSQLNPDACIAGNEIFPTVPGDPPGCAVQGKLGPHLQTFAVGLSSFSPQGSTPTAATLEALLPTLVELEGETSVVLVTDGAPNCNFEAICPSSECMPNIENASYGGRDCVPSFNCCDPDNVGPDGPGYCVDGDATERAVDALAAEGIRTFVIGLPGAEPYAALLDRLAAAGGTARGAATDYYDVGDAEALLEALYAIGTGLAIRCSLELEAAPEDPARVNVYFDEELVPAGDTDGWGWDGDQRIEVRGDACDRLSSGEVAEVRVVFGCDTVVR
jgi:hypothetical protein